MQTNHAIQKRLQELGLYTGAIDGVLGPLSQKAIREFQSMNGLTPDGIVGRNTRAELFPDYIPERDADTAGGSSPQASLRWPRQKDMNQFYGLPGNPDATAGTVVLPAPMRIAWDLTKKINTFKCHKKVVVPMTEIFRKTIEHYGEEKWRELGLDLFGGCYNNRPMRGGSRPSTHAYGIAVDIDPAHNRLRWDARKARLARKEYKPFWEIVESEGAISLGRQRDFDWMHFQFARL